MQLEALTVVRAIRVDLPPPAAASSWIVFRCLACQTDCFALEDSPTTPRCVMSLALLVDGDIAALQSSPQFSPAFNICIPPPAPTLLPADLVHTPRVQSGSSGISALSVSPSSSAVAESLRSSLEHSVHAERVAMQMRINQFVGEENARFVQFERKGKRELQQLLAFVAEERGASPHPAPASPALTRSRSPSVSPRPSLSSISPAAGGLTALPLASVFQPLSTFLRRPSRQSPRLQRLLMDGLKHSSSMSPTDDPDSARGPDDDDADDGVSTPSRVVALSSSAPRAISLNTGRTSPRQSVILPVPQLSALMRRSAHDDDAEEDEMERSQNMILKWREQEEERERDEARQADAAKARRRSARAAAKRRGSQDEEEDRADDIFFLDDTTAAEDSWTDMVLDDSAARKSTDDADILVITTNVDDPPRTSARRKDDDAADVDDAADDGEEGGKRGTEHEDEHEEDEGALSDDEAVAKTSQADILAIARRSSIPVHPASSAASRSHLRPGDMVPSSLPIPIPAALRQLMSKSGSPSTSSSNSSTKATPVTMASTADSSLRRGSLNAAPSDRRLSGAQVPIPEHIAQRSLSPEPSPTSSANAAAEPFMPPHTMLVEPFFSFSKYRHLEGVKGAGRMAGSLGTTGGWGGALSASLPSRSVMSGVLFRKEESERRKAGGVSGLSVALGRKDVVGDERSSTVNP